MRFDEALEQIQQTIGYTFQDTSLLRQAFTRASYCNEEKQRGKGAVQSNEVLEFCGDSVLGAAIVTLLMEEHGRRTKQGLMTPFDEGIFSYIKSRLTDKRMLGQQMEALGLGRYLIMGKGDESERIWEEPSVREDLFESIIAAVWLDSQYDFDTVKQLVRRWLDPDAYLAQHGTPQAASPKNAVQEWCAAHHITDFGYTVTGESGPDHDKTFSVLCYVVLPDGTRHTAPGEGRSRKKAEIAAAEAMMQCLSAI